MSKRIHLKLLGVRNKDRQGQIEINPKRNVKFLDTIKEMPEIRMDLYDGDYEGQVEPYTTTYVVLDYVNSDEEDDKMTTEYKKETYAFSWIKKVFKTP